MGWIKRNLFFSIGGVIALLLLGAAGYYDYKSWSHNSDAFDRLNEIYGKLKELGDEKPSPGNAKAEALQTAFHAISEAMYQRAQESAAADGNGNGASASGDGDSADDEDVVDAEVVDEPKA